ncbi:Alcohol dehydrogenase 4, mitochondrial [Pseudocercospora fuligena]|uniref:Alcohol dehydrogenase 4, mitochondrial n=1 Tax=Pseudocercospora fuligena TaxID=685502 RepID=A0A8H6VAQ4_9PEZI|nr:Alcohol dehydrogenase 4, mitochondrial [Pseudocercospora fuligena]
MVFEQPGPSSSTYTLPETMRALVLHSTSTSPKVETVPCPRPTTGSAIVKILAANVISYTRDVYNGKKNYPFPTPLIPGFSAIARISALGPDATKLKIGDLVFLDTIVRSRDEPSDVYLCAVTEGFTEGSKKLMREVWRDWSFAEFAGVPLENLTYLDEERLGYRIEELASIATLLVPYGGLRDIEFRPGQTIVIAPATGPFGSAAVKVALAMGGRVIAMGRNREALESLKKMGEGRVEIVPITGDMTADSQSLKACFGGKGRIDAYFDIGPPEAEGNTHIKSAILALSHGARVSLMGGYRGDISIPHATVMHKNLRLYGKWMYEREDVRDLVQMVESGVLRLDGEVVGEFGLEEWKAAWDCAAENAGPGRYVVIKP